MLIGRVPRVLLTDSSPRMRRIVRVNLEGAGCQVIESDGQDLQQQVRSADIDALVISLDVRTTDVCNAVQMLRRRLPTAIVAGYSILPPDDVVRRLCVDMYVEQPFDLAGFVARLRGEWERVTVPGSAQEAIGR